MTKHVGEFDVEWPDWVPAHVRRYIRHANMGVTIRAMADAAGEHASTVMRQVRQVEQMREEPLVDEALGWLTRASRSIGSRTETNAAPDFEAAEERNAKDLNAVADVLPAVLRRLSEPRAVLAVAEGMDRAVIVRDRTDGETVRLGVVDRPVTYALTLNRWIESDSFARITRYRITSTGRSQLNALMAEAENRAGGFDEAPPAFRHRKPARVRRRTSLPDTPVVALARRRDPAGGPFLERPLVRAAERIQDDFELAQMEPRRGQNWGNFLTAGIDGTEPRGLPAFDGAAAARDRVNAALRDLGPGLGDVVLECCCKLQGLETAEKKLGWSARSAKIVLRIALQRLKAHYESLEDGGGLVG